jgi:hypothetical protein
VVDRLLEGRLVDVELLAESEVRDEHPKTALTSTSFCCRDEDVLRLDVTVDDLERVEVP